MTAGLLVPERKLWTPDKEPIFKLPDSRRGDVLVGDLKGLTPKQRSWIIRLSDDVQEAEQKAHLQQSWVERKTNGDVVVPAPYLNILHEVELILREARLQAQARELGVKHIAGGAAGNWTFTNNTRTYILDGTFDWDNDTFKEALLLSTSNIGASSTTYAGVTNEVASAYGYTTGGAAITMAALSGTTTVTVDSSTDPVWTASGGDITGRFGLLYEVSGNVACYFLLDSSPADVTATDGNTLTITHNASGIFTLA